MAIVAEAEKIQEKVIPKLGYPKTYDDLVRYRATTYNACVSDPLVAAQMYRVCSEDIITWVDLWCWTKDPRRTPASMPFLCYDYQREYILTLQDHIMRGKDLATVKSRDMGASWMPIYVFTFFWLFRPGSDFRVGSRKEDYVDKLGDIDTLLEKVRFNLSRQPRFLLPKSFDLQKHAAYMRIINPDNGNAIVGESANPHFGSGGRRTAVLLDEFAKWDASVATAAWTATADVTPCRIVTSTYVGSSNKFAILVDGTKEKLDKRILLWVFDPRKNKGMYYIDSNGNKKDIMSPEQAFRLWQDKKYEVSSPWRDAEKLRRTAEDMAQEIDCDPLKSGRPFFDLDAVNRQQIKTPYFYELVELRKSIEARPNSSGWLRVWDVPSKWHQYQISADVAEGLYKGDESFGIVRNVMDNHVVACISGTFDPDDFLYKLFLIHKWYRDALIAPENNNHGYTVCLGLEKLGAHLYYTERDETEAIPGPTRKRGWSTTPKTRPYMLDLLKEEIRKGAITIPDEIILQQIKTFIVNKRSKPEADGDFLDDGVLALAIGSAVRQQHPYTAVEFSGDDEETDDDYAYAKPVNAGFGF